MDENLHESKLLSKLSCGAPVIQGSALGNRFLLCYLLLFALLLASGCASFKVQPFEELQFIERAQTQQDDDLQVTVSVLTSRESRQAFGVKLAKKGIQPVWLRIENRSGVPYSFMILYLDSDYFTPAEAAYKNHFRFSGRTNKKMDKHFVSNGIRRLIAPNGIQEGFVFTNIDEGYKNLNVALLGPEGIKHFNFLVNVPGLKADYGRIDWKLRVSDWDFEELSEQELIKYLEDLPCCTTNKKGDKNADPLNLIIISGEYGMAAAFTRQGWDETEYLHWGSLWKTVNAFFRGKEYRYSPMSSLYLFDCPQDISMQKARETIHERNHLRLWLTDKMFQGKDIYVGQISRDIGVRFTTKAWNLMTHKIDADVDEARDYIMEDMLVSHRVSQVGMVAGVGESTPEEPERNLTGDPYFTDGYRAVIIFSEKPLSIEEARILDWDVSSDREAGWTGEELDQPPGQDGAP